MNAHAVRLEAELRRRGVLTAREAADTLRVSQPTYDMTPMRYRPDIEGRLPDQPLAPPPPPPEALPFWTRAVVMAEGFWSRVAGTPLVSPAFRRIAERNANVVAALRR